MKYPSTVNMRAMQQARVYVSVVGFTDVERHALNTVFRLSEERDLAYAPWLPATGGAANPGLTPAEVALVDGDSAEAVLSHAKEMPAGQRLIWVGGGAPAHAWRVLTRPIQWAHVLSELDAVYAARQVDSGFIDLDVTSPAPLGDDLGFLHAAPRRALLVGASPSEVRDLRARLVLVGILEVDHARSTEEALAMISRARHACGVFNLDHLQFDVWSLANLFSQNNPQALTMGLSMHAGPLAPWWNRRRIKRDTQRTGINALVARPMVAAEIEPWIKLLQ
jgi:hypothetical protein